MGPGRFLFSGTRFQGCSLVATSGATVSAHNCTFSGSRLAAFATGTGTIIRADLATLASCVDGMVATDGAALTLHSGTFAVSAGSVAVARNSSHACLCECALKSSPQSDVERYVDCVAAIEARSGGVVDATACRVTAGAAGVAARSSGLAETLHGCTFSDLSAYGALARDGGSVTAGLAPEAANGAVADANAAATPSQVASGPGPGSVSACAAEQCDIGYVATGADAVLHLVRCSASRSVHCGVSIQAGACAELSKCTLQGSQESCGLQVGGAGSHATADSCTAKGNASRGVVVCDGARAELSDCTLSSNALDGLEVAHKGSEARALACRFQHNKRVGHTAEQASVGEGEGCTSTGILYTGYYTAKQGSLTLTECKADDNVGSGILVASGARAELCKCSLQGSQKYSGLQVGDAGSHATAGSCTAKGNAGSGVLVHSSACAELRESTLLGNTLDGLIVRHKGSKARALACSFEHNKRVGFWAEAGEGEGEGCTSIGNGDAGYCTREQGSLRLMDCSSSDGSHSAFVVRSATGTARTQQKPPSRHLLL
jgi:Right handed beta helix region